MTTVSAGVRPSGRLSGLRVAVTGGAGMVGSHLVDAALREGAADVVALDTLVRGTPENLRGAIASGRARLMSIDIRDGDAVRRAIAGVDLVFHQAALRWTRCQEAPRECQEVMVDGTFNVAEASAAERVRRIVFASSAVVYGEPRALPLNEDQPLQGTTVYGAAKVAGEQMLRALDALHGTKSAVLRYFNVYGPRMDIRSRYVEVMVRWLDLIDARRPLTLLGDGTQSADFVFIEDVVEANIRAAIADGPSFIVNVCSGIETRMCDLAELLLELTGSSVGITYQPDLAHGLPARRFGDPARAERLLGFRARTTLREGIAALIEWRATQLAAQAASA